MGAQWEKNAGVKAPGPFAGVSKKTKGNLKKKKIKKIKNPTAWLSR